MGDKSALLDFRKRFDELKASESQRQTLIQDLIEQNEKLLHEYQQVSLDLESEKGGRRLLQGRIRDELDPMKNRRAFVLVLLDADGDNYVVRQPPLTQCCFSNGLRLQFLEDFLNKNEEGGRHAADELLARVKQYL
ncbi:MAG: hypothetical protein Q9166_004761 [cf. Caloplaca sp. 2 TL-2023]